jgi:hypothetical protein
VRRLLVAFGNSHHQWMWDYDSLAATLTRHGFVSIRQFYHGDCEDEMFLRPERSYQFGDQDQPYGLAICRKSLQASRGR